MWKKIRKGLPVDTVSGRFMVNSKDSTFIIKTDKAEYKYKILNLSKSCFEYRKMDDDAVVRMDRL